MSELLRNMTDDIPTHYVVNNATGYCEDAMVTSWIGRWPTPCVLETVQSGLHTLFVMVVFQFALSMLAQRPDAPVPAPQPSYHASVAMRLGISLAAVTTWLGAILFHGLAKLEMPPYHTLLMVTSATAWICYLALSMELDVTEPLVLPSVLYRCVKAAWLGGQMCLGIAIAATSKLGDTSQYTDASQYSSSDVYLPTSSEDEGSAGGGGGAGPPPMAGIATLLLQQFSLVVQLSINIAAVLLELYDYAMSDRASAGAIRDDSDGLQAALLGSPTRPRRDSLPDVAGTPSGSGVGQPEPLDTEGPASPPRNDPAGVQQLGIRLYFVCAGFGTRMMWYSLNVALPYFTQLYGPKMYPRMLLGYNLGAMASLFGQVIGDAHFDAKYGPVVTTAFRVNLGMGLMFLLMVYFPHTANDAWIPVALSVAVGVLDYFATGSLTQMASRVGGIMPNFFFLGQALSGAFLFGFTTSVDWSVEEMAINNVQHYKHNHQDVVWFFGYASAFVASGQIAFNFLVSSEYIKQLHNIPADKPWYHQMQWRSPSGAAAGGGRAGHLQQVGNGGSQLSRSLEAFRMTWALQASIIILWVSLLSVQALFGLNNNLQEPLMFVNLFGLMGGMQINVLFAKWMEGMPPNGLLMLVVATMPTVATLFALQAFGVCAFSDYVVVSVTAGFYVLGGSCWMLCYTIVSRILPSDAMRTEATRLLNLMTQFGILAGVGIGMLLVNKAEDLKGHAGSGPGLYELYEVRAWWWHHSDGWR